MFFHDLFYFWRRSFFIHCLGSCHPFLKHIVYKKNHTLLKRNGACPQLEIRSNHLVATKVARFAELRLEMPAVQYFWCHDRSKDISKRILLRPRPHYAGGVSKRKLDYENTSRFLSTSHQRNFKTQLLPSSHFGVVLWGILGQGRNHMIIHEAIVFDWKAPFWKWFTHEKEKSEFSNSHCLKSVFKKLCFCYGLVWNGRSLGLIVEIKLRFQKPNVTWQHFGLRRGGRGIKITTRSYIATDARKLRKKLHEWHCVE